MPRTALTPSFVPYESLLLAPIDGEILNLIFTTKADLESDVKCGQVITLDCKEDGIAGMNGVVFEWTPHCSDTIRKTQDDDDYPHISIVFSPDDGEPVIEVICEIAVGIVATKNKFKLFGVINDIETLLARGVLYTEE